MLKSCVHPNMQSARYMQQVRLTPAPLLGRLLATSAQIAASAVPARRHAGVVAAVACDASHLYEVTSKVTVGSWMVPAGMQSAPDHPELISHMSSIEAAVSACCAAIQRPMGPAEEALVPVSPLCSYLCVMQDWTYLCLKHHHSLAEGIPMQVEQLQQNWYSTAGDVAAMTEVCFLFAVE